MRSEMLRCHNVLSFLHWKVTRKRYSAFMFWKAHPSSSRWFLNTLSQAAVPQTGNSQLQPAQGKAEGQKHMESRRCRNWLLPSRGIRPLLRIPPKEGATQIFRCETEVRKDKSKSPCTPGHTALLCLPAAQLE